MPTILVLQGPNLNWLGKREPHIYGSMTLEDIHDRLRERADQLGLVLKTVQSNHEGVLIDTIQEQAATIDGIIVNAGALTHTSIALRDALSAVSVPIMEVHLSNIHARESFRHHSYISALASGVIVGLGWRGYLWALEELALRIQD